MALNKKFLQRERTISHLNSQLNQAIDTIGVLNNRHQEIVEHMSVLELELEEEKHKSVEFSELFAQQQEISKAKIEAVESKYETIKQINLGLEKKIFQLHADLERYQEKIITTGGTEQQDKSEKIL